MFCLHSIFSVHILCIFLIIFTERSGCYAVNISAFTPGNTLGSFINATGFTLESCLSNCSSMGYYFAAPFVPSTGNQLMCGCLHNFQHLDLQSDSRCNSTCGISMCGGLDAAGIYSPQGEYMLWSVDAESVWQCF